MRMFIFQILDEVPDQWLVGRGDHARDCVIPEIYFFDFSYIPGIITE